MLLTLLLSIYFVTFTDKSDDAHLALSDTAIVMRQVHDIPLDSLDYSVSPTYLDSLRSAGAVVLHTSRWMNGATVRADSAVIRHITDYPFVQSVELTRDNSVSSIRIQQRKQRWRNETTNYGYAQQQLETYNLLPLHAAGFLGQGIRMAVIDGGFENADTMEAFDSVRSQILGHYDFTDDRDGFYGETGTHGSMCLSVIAGKCQDFHGAATAAQYYLMRSEESDTESPKEMDNWIAAIETADSLGVHISSTSLGYSIFDNQDFDLTYQDMDGCSTRASRAATIAARKGMLVVVAAGNDGDDVWHYITAPADADSILTVGAVACDSTIAAFSSYGPTYDGRMKPEVCAVGKNTVLVRPSNGVLVYSNGTSFACPLLAGMAACLWSALPDEDAMSIRERIIRSAHLFKNPDDHYGYGIPNAWNAYTNTSDGIENTLQGEKSKNATCKKLLIGSSILILRQGVLYDLQGQVVSSSVLK